MIPPNVTVTLDGAIVAASTDASLVDGTVVAPASPFVEALAGRLVLGESGTIVIEGAGRRITLHLGARTARVDDAATSRDIALPYAPAERAGVVLVPLAAVARALGYEARFEPSAEPVLALRRDGEPIGTPAAATAPPGPYVTFEPRAVATPARPLPSAVPRPRRTPIHEFDPSPTLANPDPTLGTAGPSL